MCWREKKNIQFMTLCPLRVSPTFRRNILLSSSRVKFRYKGQIVFCRIIATDDRIARLETLNTASDRRNWGILEYLGYSSLPLKGLSDGGHYSDVNTCRRTHLRYLVTVVQEWNRSTYYEIIKHAARDTYTPKFLTRNSIELGAVVRKACHQE